MTDTAMVPCIVCDKELQNVESTCTNQPYKGTAFTSNGHYGSTSFDPMNGSMIEINICDDCLSEKGKDNKVLWRREANALVDRTGSIFGWIENPDTPYVFWNPDLDHIEDDDLEDERQDGLIRIPVESHKELLELIETHGIRTNGRVKLIGGWTEKNTDWLDDPAAL